MSANQEKKYELPFLTIRSKKLFFPKQIVTIQVKKDISSRAVSVSNTRFNGNILVGFISNFNTEVPTKFDVHPIILLAKITNYKEKYEGAYLIDLLFIERVDIIELTFFNEGFLMAGGNPLIETDFPEKQEITEFVAHIAGKIRKSNFSTKQIETIDSYLLRDTNISQLCDYLAADLNLPHQNLIELLVTPSIKKRMDILKTSITTLNHIEQTNLENSSKQTSYASHDEMVWNKIERVANWFSIIGYSLIVISGISGFITSIIYEAYLYIFIVLLSSTLLGLIVMIIKIFLVGYSKIVRNNEEQIEERKR